MKIDSGFFKYIYKRTVTNQAYTKRWFITLFIVAMLVGAGLKAVATQTITIGFDDYTLASNNTLYDFNVLQRQLIEQNPLFAPRDIIAGKMCTE